MSDDMKTVPVRVRKTTLARVSGPTRISRDTKIEEDLEDAACKKTLPMRPPAAAGAAEQRGAPAEEPSDRE